MSFRHSNTERQISDDVWTGPAGHFALRVNRAALIKGEDYRLGYERTTGGTAVVLWLDKTYALNAAEDHPTVVSITL